MKRLLITGGAGFVGSNLAVLLKGLEPHFTIGCFDNLKRRGSELALPRLRHHGIAFYHGDVRCPEDFEQLPPFDLLVDCAAETSVLAGTTGAPLQVLNPNLVGTIHCLEAARKRKAALLFLSTSRVYPIAQVNALDHAETDTRFELLDRQTLAGCSAAGITEDFPMTGARSFYGASKLAAELLVQEYVFSRDLRALINRCGNIAGPWQMGKVDQGVITFWMAQHFFQRELCYLGFGGQGKQVRDLLHVADLADLVHRQIRTVGSWDGRIYNVGGGRPNAVSLRELTEYCVRRTGNKLAIKEVAATAPTDVRIYITDASRAQNDFQWHPTRGVENIVDDIYQWLAEHREELRNVL